MGSENLEIANNILNQLGGNMLKHSINIKNIMLIPNGASFRFSGCRKLNYCKIILNVWDTYDIEFGQIGTKKTDIPKIRLPEYTKVKTIDMVYCDNLTDFFEKETGLYLTLFPRK